ncbi:hypothetical protein ElyMa_000883700 [Elysia marginata]|uniref:Amino acid transporter transmembrane domain-containing protein n=1 Tax=Elysia marginata TaxID=1093978 RepID=A0AAV4H8H5_9GAST|nr:hypothetical protein ElyMa_000883700 [Elysia marginata]
MNSSVDGITTAVQIAGSRSESVTSPSLRSTIEFNSSFRENLAFSSTSTTVHGSPMLSFPLSRKDTLKVSEEMAESSDMVWEEKENAKWSTKSLKSEFVSLHTNTSETEPIMKPLSQKEGTYIPLPGVLGILGYICLDIGFDLGNPTCRAFILEHSPSSQHTNLLVTATQSASLAGLLMSSLGVFDLPAGIEALFGVDGTAGTFILMLAVILIIIISFFGCSLWTGVALRKNVPIVKDMKVNDAGRLRRKGMNSNDNSFTQNPLGVTETHLQQQKVDYKASLDTSENPSFAIKQEEACCLTSSKEQTSSPTDEYSAANDKAPLLSKPSGLGTNLNTTYMSLSLNVPSVGDSSTDLTLPGLEPMNASEFHDPSKSQFKLEDIPEHPVNLAAIPSTSQSHSLTVSSELIKDLGHPTNNDLQFEHFLGSINDVSIKTQCSHSYVTATSPFDYDKQKAPQGPHDHFKDQEDAIVKIRSTSTSPPFETPLFNKRLVILVISTAISVSSLVGIVMYSSNAITLGIYKADPTAELGTPENLNYREGLRTAAMGNVVFYISYFVSCLLNKKSFQIFGEYNFIFL